MTDLLIYWRDYQQNWSDEQGEHLFRWHSKARLFERLSPGDWLWMVTAGKNLNGACAEAPQAGFLVGVWQIQRVVQNLGDDPAYPPENFRYRIIADASASVMLEDPVLVDGILRPAGRDPEKAIGAFLQGPRRLKDEKVRLLKAAAGAELARHYLTGKRS